jgi:hypothetical protein
MANFSVNQVRHLYVLKKQSDPTATAATAGYMDVKSDADGAVYLLYKNAKGEIVRSDLIPKGQYSYAKIIASAKQAHVKSCYDIALATGHPVAGQDYIVRINFKEFAFPSYDSQYIKYGCVRAVTDMTADTFYKELMKSLSNNFSREAAPLVDIQGKVGTSYKSYSSIGSGDTVTAVRIVEVAQPYSLGVQFASYVPFDVELAPVVKNGDEVTDWATVTKITTEKFNNGRDIADLEYFSMGERGDLYRNMGWPRVVPTQYMVDSTTAYATLDIQYHFIGSGIDSVKSEKTITVVCAEADKAELTALGTALGTAGITVTGTV